MEKLLYLVLILVVLATGYTVWMMWRVRHFRASYGKRLRVRLDHMHRCMIEAAGNAEPTMPRHILPMMAKTIVAEHRADVCPPAYEICRGAVLLMFFAGESAVEAAVRGDLAAHEAALAKYERAVKEAERLHC